jgi:hypothetical protein
MARIKLDHSTHIQPVQEPGYFFGTPLPTLTKSPQTPCQLTAQHIHRMIPDKNLLWTIIRQQNQVQKRLAPTEFFAGPNLMIHQGSTANHAAFQFKHISPHFLPQFFLNTTQNVLRPSKPLCPKSAISLTHQ